jgi:hypothetical protein
MESGVNQGASQFFGLPLIIVIVIVILIDWRENDYD